jgi:hypothetical protein
MFNYLNLASLAGTDSVRGFELWKTPQFRIIGVRLQAVSILATEIPRK